MGQQLFRGSFQGVRVEVPGERVRQVRDIEGREFLKQHIHNFYKVRIRKLMPGFR
jgi:hypothetical protein